MTRRNLASEYPNQPKLQRIGSQDALGLRRSAVAQLIIQPSSHPAAEALQGTRFRQDTRGGRGCEIYQRVFRERHRVARERDRRFESIFLQR